MIQRRKHRNSRLFLLVSIALLTSAGGRADTNVLSYVTIPVQSNETSSNIQTVLINTFPTGIFTANNALATPFSIPDAAGNCGASEKLACNFYVFLPASSGASLTIDVSIPGATDVYTLMNATTPEPGQQLATIQFAGTGGTSLKFPLIAGEDIRDYYRGAFANTLTNGITGVEASNAFTCVDPKNCLGSGGTGNVETGNAGTYVIDEQHFSLGSAFAGQTLTQIIITDTYGGSRPFLLGVTVGSNLGAPLIATGGVVTASAFGGFAAAAPGSWIEIYGSNLAASTQEWTSAEFNGVNAPTSVGGTSVSVRGEAAFIDYISPGQVNAQIPSGVGIGSQPVVVKTGAGTSSVLNVAVKAQEPGLLAPASFDIGGIQYVAALFADGTYALPAGAIAGVSSRAATPGDTVVLYGVGFGPVTPDIPAGQIVQQTNQLQSDFQVSIGGVEATVQYAGLAPNYVGLYQFNVVVPNVPTNDAAPVTFTLAGTSGTQTLYMAVQN